MSPYELMIKTNHYLIKGGVLTECQKQNIVKQFIGAVSDKNAVIRFYNGVKFPNNIDRDGRRMYPIFYIPPFNDGKKYKTILFQTPKTQILSANMYELEIIRLLHILEPENITIRNMVELTLERLKTTCFGNRDDGLGECFDSSLVVLRFLAGVSSNDKKWIQERIDNYNNHVEEKKRPWFSLWYFWLCLSELPFELAEKEIEKYRSEILKLINRSYVMNSEQDKTIHPVLLCILRNIICKYPEYEYIKNRQPFINQKDNRLYFDMGGNYNGENR